MYIIKLWMLGCRQTKRPEHTSAPGDGGENIERVLRARGGAEVDARGGGESGDGDRGGGVRRTVRRGIPSITG